MPFTGQGTGIANADDIFFSSVAGNDTLAFNSSTQKWNNVPASSLIAGDNLVYDITAYGATTATNDNKTAIDNAIAAAAATGGVVYFPPGTWKTTGQHTIPLNVSIVGAGKGITTISHRGVGTHCFFLGSYTDGPSPKNYMGGIRDFSIQGQSGGDGTGVWGQQVGIFVLNCIFFNIQDIHMSIIYKAFMIDGGDEVALGASTFSGNGYVANCTTSNVYIGFHIYRWVTDSIFNFIYCYGNSPIAVGSVGIWIENKMSTSTFLNPSVEGLDMGFRIGTSRQGLSFINPRLENCTTDVLWENSSWGHTILGGSDLTNITWASGSKIGQNTQIARDGFFPVVAALPSASSAYRRAIYRVIGGAGVADGLYMCVKDATDTYGWVNLAGSSSGGGGGSGLLTSKTYHPASITTLSTTANTTTFQDIDATNLVVTFTAPSSGKVLLRLSGLVSRTGTAANFDVYWNVRDGSGDVAGVGGRVMTSSGSYFSATISQVVAGLVPGNSYTWKWGHRASALGADWQANLRVGGDPAVTPAYAPATMEIWSA